MNTTAAIQPPLTKRGETSRATIFQAALDLFQARRFPEAAAAFKTLTRLGTDREFGYERLATEASRLAGAPPPADWNGAIALDSK